MAASAAEERADRHQPVFRALPHVRALGCDLRSEQGAQATVKGAIAQRELSRDYASRDLFQHILHDTEERIDFLETQLDLVAKVGEQNYLQSQMSPHGSWAPEHLSDKGQP